MLRIAKHAITKTIKGDKFPLVLMLEPLLRCNLACPGCGKIDYPDAILNRRLSFQECMDAIEDCGAPPSRSPVASRCFTARWPRSSRAISSARSS
jgi:MoaA/NifB/PqqE/SkfB family radical SAM enzyme